MRWKKTSGKIQNLDIVSKKCMGFFPRKKTWTFQSRERLQTCCRMCIKWYYSVKNYFPTFMWSLLAKYLKFLELEELDQMIEKENITRKKRYHFFERRVYQKKRRPKNCQWLLSQYPAAWNREILFLSVLLKTVL